MLKEILKNKRIKVIGAFFVFILFITVLNISFSAFTQDTNKRAANITVGNLSYTINGNESFSIKANKNDITRNNITLLNLDNLDTKYEITYDVYTDENLSNKVDKPNGLKVEYSSLSPDSVKGILNKTDSKSIRLIITNETDTDYYVKLGVNGGFAYNVLEYKNDITSEYIEDDLYIAAIIDGNISSTFPITNNYTPRVECNNNASGHVTWDGSKWNFNLSSSVTQSETKCNVYFTSGANYLKDAIMTNNSSIIVNDASTLTNKPGQAISGENEKFLVKTPDDYGDSSYIFRGNIDNNYVVFANKCWKIVRITGNNAIKLVLQNSDGADCSEVHSAGESAFNNAPGIYDTVGGIGLMYGTPTAETYEEAQANISDSSILIFLKGWYSQTFKNSNTEKIADVIWCNDKSLISGDGFGYSQTIFAGEKRIINDKNPSLVCPTAGSDGKLSKLTANDTTNGNGKLKGFNGSGTTEFKIGLLTVDEVAFAGGVWNMNNQKYYLFNGLEYFLLTPDHYNSNNKRARLMVVGTTGRIYNLNASNARPLFPSIALNSNVTYYLNGTGTPGTVNNPYIVV